MYICLQLNQCDFSDEVEAWHIIVALLLVGAVTGGRVLILNAWPEFKAASDKSNTVVSSCSQLDKQKTTSGYCSKQQARRARRA